MAALRWRDSSIVSLLRAETVRSNEDPRIVGRCMVEGISKDDSGMFWARE